MNLSERFGDVCFPPRPRQQQPCLQRDGLERAWVGRSEVPRYSGSGILWLCSFLDVRSGQVQEMLETVLEA